PATFAWRQPMMPCHVGLIACIAAALLAVSAGPVCARGGDKALRKGSAAGVARVTTEALGPKPSATASSWPDVIVDPSKVTLDATLLLPFGLVVPRGISLADRVASALGFDTEPHAIVHLRSADPSVDTVLLRGRIGQAPAGALPAALLASDRGDTLTVTLIP